MSNLYVLVEWPDSQSLMEESWFEDEAILTESSAYFVPIDRYNKLNEQQYRCPLCKGTDIESKAWVNLNTLEFVEFADDEEDFCVACKELIRAEENLGTVTPAV